MRINIGEIQGKQMTKEFGFEGRVEGYAIDLKARFTKLQNKGVIALLAIPKAVATTVTKTVLLSLAFFADRFVSTGQTLRDPQRPLMDKVVALIALPIKLAAGAVGLGIGLALSPLLIVAYTIQALMMMNTRVREIQAENARGQHADLMKRINSAQ
jgi:hypothetical protein